MLLALTIVRGVRDAWSVWRRGRLGTVCARDADLAWSSGPSTSPLESATRFDFAANSTRLKSRGQDALFDAAGKRARRGFEPQ